MKLILENCNVTRIPSDEAEGEPNQVDAGGFAFQLATRAVPRKHRRRPNDLQWKMHPATWRQFLGTLTPDQVGEEADPSAITPGGYVVVQDALMDTGIVHFTNSKPGGLVVEIINLGGDGAPVFPASMPTK